MLVERIIILLTHLLLKLKKFLESHISQQLLLDFMFLNLFQKVKNYQIWPMLPMKQEVMCLTFHLIILSLQNGFVVMDMNLILEVKKLMYQQIHQLHKLATHVLLDMTEMDTEIVLKMMLVIFVQMDTS